MRTILTAAVSSAAAVLAGSTARGAIILSLSSPQDGQTVPVGSTIHALVAASTDNPNGIASLQARLETTLDGMNADVHPFHFSLIATNPSNTTTNQAVTSSFNSALSDPNTLLAKATAKFGIDGQPSVSPTGNEPLFGFTGDGPGGRASPRFYSPANANLTQFFDVSFRADNPGTVQFKFADNVPNSVQGYEYNNPFVDGTSAVDSSLANISTMGGFSITASPVPEPGMGTAMAGAGSLLLLRPRRRK